MNKQIKDIYCDGFTKLVFKKKDNMTIASYSYTSGHSQISAPIYLENDCLCYYLISFGGGFLDNEKYYNEFILEENSHVILTTQSATKIYRNDSGQPTIQTTNIKLSDNSYLELINDPLIMFENAKFLNLINIEMTYNSGLVYSEIITSGYASNQLPFKYQDYHSTIKILKDKNLVFIDNTKITPSLDDVIDIGILDGYKHFGTLIIIHPLIDTILLSKIKHIIQSYENIEFINFGVSLLETQGLIIRGTSNLTSNLHELFMLIINFFRQSIYNLPNLNLRKT